MTMFKDLDVETRLVLLSILVANMIEFVPTQKMESLFREVWIDPSDIDRIVSGESDVSLEGARNHMRQLLEQRKQEFVVSTRAGQKLVSQLRIGDAVLSTDGAYHVIKDIH